MDAWVGDFSWGHRGLEGEHGLRGSIGALETFGGLCVHIHYKFRKILTRINIAKIMGRIFTGPCMTRNVASTVNIILAVNHGFPLIEQAAKTVYA